jgi:hypothetical protein
MIDELRTNSKIKSLKVKKNNNLDKANKNQGRQILPEK